MTNKEIPPFLPIPHVRDMLIPFEKRYTFLFPKKQYVNTLLLLMNKLYKKLIVFSFKVKTETNQ